ncbi:MAG: hypothetical protein HYR74_06770, partial [Candidatus Eisenbacteria bacterium]|nr:hypothetical protein [Candidatus Eisenbacteria bacterium]
MKPCLRLASLVLFSISLAALLPIAALAQAPLRALSCPTATITTPTSIASGDLTYDNMDVVVQGTTLTIAGPHTFCNLTVQSGGVVQQVATDAGGVDLTLTSNCTVDGTSAITVAGLGYASGTGPGSPGSTSPYCGGAAYGGEGGDGSS